MRNATRSEVRSTAFRRKFVEEGLPQSTNFRLNAVLRTLLGVMGLLAVVGIALRAAPHSPDGSSSIDIVEVKNVGISAANDAKSVIQVKWTAKLPPGSNVKSFDVSLEVKYADRTKEKMKYTVNGSADGARFEVPTLHLSPGKPAAELRRFEATVTANFSETATKQGNL